MPALALPAPGASSTPNEAARQKVGELLNQMTAGFAPQQAPQGRVLDGQQDVPDPLKLIDGCKKNWARRMLQNPKGKSITSLKMAHKALGLEYVPAHRKES